MNKKEAEKILGEGVHSDGGLSSFDHVYVDYTKGHSDEICLDGNFTLKQLEAIVWWIQYHG
jgi:hypothetical protein